MQFLHPRPTRQQSPRHRIVLTKRASFVIFCLIHLYFALYHPIYQALEDKTTVTQQKGLWSWLLQRLTGLYLIFGMAVHIIILPLGKEAITFESVSFRLQHAGWLIFDLLLLTVCVYHGFNGLWSVFMDFNPSEKVRRGVGWGLALFGLVWIVYGIFVLIPFAK